MFSFPLWSLSSVLSLYSVLLISGAFAETFLPSQVYQSSQQTYRFGLGPRGWYPYENANAASREWPLLVSPGSPTLFIVCYDDMTIGLTNTPRNGSSIDSFGLHPRTGNLTLKITDPEQANITFESRCENPAPADTTARRNAWKLPKGVNDQATIYGPCCALEFNVPSNYTGDLYYQDLVADSFSRPLIIAANITSINNTTSPPNTTTASGTTTTSTTTTAPPVPTSTPLPPNTTTAVPTTATPTSTPTSTVPTSTTSPPTKINSTNSSAPANSASGSLFICSYIAFTIFLVSHFAIFN